VAQEKGAWKGTSRLCQHVHGWQPKQLTYREHCSCTDSPATCRNDSCIRHLLQQLVSLQAEDLARHTPLKHPWCLPGPTAWRASPSCVRTLPRARLRSCPTGAG
jgi:hypothetical protein